MTEQTRKITGLHRLSTNLCAHRILLTDAAATDWSAVHPTSIEPLRDEWDATCEMNEYKVPPEQFLGLELSPQRRRHRPARPLDRLLPVAAQNHHQGRHRRPPALPQNPDESATIALFDYQNPRCAEWPQADYIFGNPPFVGASRMRDALGDGYTESLRKAWKGDVSESAEFVMFEWQNAAAQVVQGTCKQFGFITTHSIHQTHSRTNLTRMQSYVLPRAVLVYFSGLCLPRDRRHFLRHFDIPFFEVDGSWRACEIVKRGLLVGRHVAPANNLTGVGGDSAHDSD